MFNIFKNKTNYKKGNTLSETLIALVIVGVVFTISIGTIVADYNKNQTTVRLKKVYSTLANAMTISISRNGPVDTWELEQNLSEKGSYLFFENYIKPYLVISRDCKNSTEGQCNFVFKELDGTEKSLNSTWVRFFLNDGVFIGVQSNADEKYKVLYFYVDSNGKKRLNVVARDIFIFEYWIQNDEHPEYVGRFLPYGHQYSREELISESNPNNCNRVRNGNYCSALIMADQWSIVTGYPWAQARYVVK